MSSKVNTHDAKTIIAIDQHAKTSTLYAFNTQTGESKTRRFLDCPSYIDFISWLDKWAQKAYYFAYESGPCGFELARQLRAAGYMCDVIAISTIPRSKKDKVTKDDTVDAKSLLGALQNKMNNLESQFMFQVLKLKDGRDIVRQYFSISKELRRAKQQLNAFLLRHGFVFNLKTITGKPKKLWTQDHYKWLKSLKFQTTIQTKTYTTYFDRIQSLELELMDQKQRIDEFAKESRFSSYIECMCAIKGIRTLTALTFCVEIDDFERFSSGRALASYLGLIPKRNNSGNKVSSGSITKCGDKNLRRALVEGFSAVSRFGSCSVNIDEQKNIPEPIRLEIKKINKRISKRYKTLRENHKNHNVIKVALAKEAACHMLYIAKTKSRIDLQDCAYN